MCLLLMFILITSISTWASSEELILTDFIENNAAESAKNASKVDASHFLGIKSHSGFFKVDDRFNSSVFFWYFPIESKPVNETPWIIWLQGGPGASSMVGLFNEIGPFEYKDSLKLREWSWGKEYSLLFIDNPVGVGYSFTENDEGLATNMETYGDHLYSTVKQFVTVFSELQHAPLYIAGQSYAGHYVPALATRISQHKSTFDINLKGIILGNPVLDQSSIVDISSVYYNVGLIDSQQLEAAKPLQAAYYDHVHSGDYVQAYKDQNDLFDYLHKETELPQLHNYLKDEIELNSYEKYLQRDDVREAIHVGTRHKIGPVFKKLLPDFLTQMRPIIEDLLEKYEILIYCGQLDLVAPCTLNAEARRKEWKWSGRRHFMSSVRHAWIYNNSVTGYVKSGGGLTEVLLRGVGHLAPLYNPPATFNIIQEFINQKLQISNHSSEVIVIHTPLDITQPLDVKTVIVMVSLVFNVLLVGVVTFLLVRKVVRNKEMFNSWLYDVVDERVHNNVLEIV